MYECEIDVEKLRADLVNFFEGAFFVGGFGAAIEEIDEIKNADSDRLIEIADENNFDLENYYIE